MTVRRGYFVGGNETSVLTYVVADTEAELLAITAEKGWLGYTADTGSLWTAGPGGTWQNRIQLSTSGVGVPGATGPPGPPGGQGPRGIGGWCVLADAAALVWTNMPAALTELFAATSRRTKKNLTGATQARIVANQTVAGSTNAILKLQYSTDQNTWTDAGPTVAVGAGVGLKVGAFANLVTAAKADVFLRLAGFTGDGAADPAFGNIDVEII